MTEPSVPAVVLMTEEEAEAVTVELKAKALVAESSVEAFEEVLVRAHDGGAWKVRRHKSWGAYVQEESGLSKRRANQLVAHVKFKAALTAASGGNTVPTFSEEQGRNLGQQGKADAVEEVAASETPDEAQHVIDRVIAKAKEAKRTRNFDPRQLTLNLTDAESAELNTVAVATNTLSDALAGQLLRAAVDLAALLVQAGVTDPVAFLSRTVRELLETGEVPVIPASKAVGQRRQREPAAAPTSNGECRHVASKPKSSGLVVCELCGLPRTRWAVAVGAAGPRVERRAVDVPTAFKGSGKK